MASKRMKYARVLRYSEEFTAGLSSAILEWVLIFLLFVNALFSYLVTKFARLCKLKIPCLLCSRLDHVFGNEKPGFYRDLVCGAHKLEVSSLVYCRVHDKLADAHEMCDSCLFSSTIEKKSNSEIYRSLVAKLGVDHENSVDKNPLYENSRLHSSNEIHCSCCTELWKPKPLLFPKKSNGSDFGKFDFHLNGSVGHSGLRPSDGLKKRRAYLRDRRIDPLSHVGYSELNITSDSDSEVLLSDDDDTSSLTHDINNLKEEESVPQFVQPESHTIVSEISLDASNEVSVPNKIIDQGSIPVTSLSVDHTLLDVAEPDHMTSSASDSVAGINVEELNLKECDRKAYPPALLDLISFHDEPSASNIDKVVAEVTRRNFDVMGTGDLVGTSKDERGVCTSETGLTIVQYSDKDYTVEGPGETFDSLRTNEVGQISSSGSGDRSQVDSLLTELTDPGPKRDQGVSIPAPSLFSILGLGEAYKRPIGNNGGQPSLMFSEKFTGIDVTKVHGDLRVLIPQRPASRGSDVTVSDASPRVHGVPEELKIPDGSSSIDLDTLQKRMLIERNDSGFDSLDGVIVSEIEGESELDRMKRQFQYDLSVLYKELDDERNASAIAANQAMAMITRLQEEKAALHMEALQYLRMMEEQAEYDMEALQKANDLLAEREKEIQDLEADLDYYRIKYPEEEDTPEPFDVANSRVGNRCVENGTNGACHMLSTKKSMDSVTSEKNDAGSSSYDTSITKS